MPRIPPVEDRETETSPLPETAPEAGPETQTERETTTTSEEEPECENCPDCEPLKQGRPFTRHFGSVGAAARRGYDYQHFVCPWHAYSPATNEIDEWRFGEAFDGFDAAQCHLYEAKHGYDGFLRQDDWSPSGRPDLEPWFERSGSTLFDDMQDEARRQASTVTPHYPTARLTWVFSNVTMKLFVYQGFLDGGLVPSIVAEVRPFTAGVP